MTFVVTRVLIINNQLRLAIRLKQALEQAGAFEVTPFTTLDAALDFLETRPQDAVLVDFSMPSITGTEIILRIRSVQPEIVVVGSPNNDDVQEQAQTLALDAVIDIPINARDLIPILERALARVNDTLPDTTEAPILNESETIVIEQTKPEVPDFTSLDSVLVRMGGLETPEGTETLDVEIPKDDGDESSSLEIALTGKLTELNDDVELLPDTSKSSSDLVFEQLAAEEPPIESLEQSGTVHDLLNGLADTDMNQVADLMMRDQAIPPAGQSLEDDESEENTAQMVLQSALDETSPLVLSLQDLLENIERQFPEDVEGVKPLPSWVQSLERYVNEPDFLQEPLLEVEDSAELNSKTTQMHDVEAIEGSSVDMETEVIQAETEPEAQLVAEAESNKGSESANEDSESIPVEVTVPLAELPPYEFDDVLPVDEQAAEEPSSDVDEILELDGPSEAAPAELPPYEFDRDPDVARITEESQAIQTATLRERITLGTESDDPEMTQLALNLTQASLELTAEATLLAQAGEIVAYAGNLPIEEIDDLRGIISDDWSAQPGEARIRFITLPSSGQDYMLYSRQTEDDFTLSMIFAGNMPLRVIRRQSDRLIEALQSVPQIANEPVDTAEIAELEQLEVEAAREEETAEEFRALIAQTVPDQELVVEARTAYTYMWLVRDPEMGLTQAVATAIVEGLDAELSRKRWQIQTLHVFEDYVYLLADVPDETPNNEVIPQLKQISANLATQIDSQLDPETLWADSYCVLAPGRELGQDEIQYFINFSRLH